MRGKKGNRDPSTDRFPDISRWDKISWRYSISDSVWFHMACKTSLGILSKMSKKRVCSIQFSVIWHEKLAGCGCFIPNISRFFTHMTHAEEVEIKYQCIHLLYSFFQNCSHRVLPDFTQFTGEIELDYLDVIAIV